MPDVLEVNKGNIFVPFTKMEKDEETGHVKVYGQVADALLDVDGQTTDLNWFRQEIQGWEKWMNVREMHQPSAVGVGLEVHDFGDSFSVLAEIVDPLAVEKVLSGVYKGFSYGVKGVPGNPFKVVKDIGGAPNGRICGGAIAEISIVDRPALPAATFNIVKNMQTEDLVVIAGADKDMAIEAIEAYEMEDSQLMAAAANLVRMIMIRRLKEVADWADGDISPFLSTMGYIYDELLYMSQDEAIDSWEAMVDRFIGSISEGASAGEATADDATKVLAIEKVKAGSVPALQALYASVVKVMPSLTETVMASPDAEACTCPETCDCQPNCAGNCTCCGEGEKMDKTMLAEAIKSMTGDERKELGIIPMEEFEAIKAEVAEMGKKVQVGGPSAAPAIPTIAQMTEGAGLVAEKAMWAAMEDSVDPQTRGLARMKVAEIQKAIDASANKLG